MYDERRLYDDIQRDFPLQPRPFQCVAQAHGLSEQAVLGLLARDLGAGRVSRIGAVFAPNTIGVSTLAALKVEPAWLDRVAARVSANAAVSHNYARHGHAYNLWFVAGARHRATLDAALAAIAAETGQRPLDLPLEREYHIDLGFPLRGAAARPAWPAVRMPSRQQLNDDDWRLVAALEAGLPLTPRPYHALARQCGLPLDRVLTRLSQWHACGVIRRFGAILHHRRFGYDSNAMCVWDVPDGRVDALGQRLARLGVVSLCYRRPRRPPHWPYNLFVMVHARSEDELHAALALFDQQCGLAAAPRAVLLGSQCYKQRGTRYAGAPASP
ncbi:MULTISPECIES: siroheme decarboxylase subunit beta [Cupriavidus]|uniref:siroheme decarboxylase subunit beta n=1 Tax=Cupriavidus TaxID=106589 RepID=UPI00037F5375|nr:MULTISPECIES: Lrp/AsnC family transcriptional regulator [Cupriavidus]